MIDLRLINLQEGDSQSDVANKLNYNFNVQKIKNIYRLSRPYKIFKKASSYDFMPYDSAYTYRRRK